MSKKGEEGESHVAVWGTEHSRQREEPVHRFSCGSVERRGSEKSGGVNGARHKVPRRLVRIWTLRVEESRKVSFSLIL